VVEVAREQSFSRAASNLLVAQQAVSQQVTAIKDALGVQLFTRTNRGVEVTVAGEAFVQEARRTLKAADRLGKQAQAAARGEVGRENRRLDAREQLRAAHDMFNDIGAEAFGERARASRARRRSDQPAVPARDALGRRVGCRQNHAGRRHGRHWQPLVTAAGQILQSPA
jgi:hypothetical protein